ncbi:hypothetical protein JCM33374_g420 [Metschnikowia sp. JCM 33374]|nr:hypothetical protein JCM33374_g420 [Metschnikowia sp. JCM 33374]
MSSLTATNPSSTPSTNHTELEDYIDVEKERNGLQTERVDEQETTSSKPPPSEDSTNEKVEPEPVAYRGTPISPLSYFGSFEIDPETPTLKWISDHTSGNVHPDMKTISMLYNQDLTLPETAQRFIEQSPELLEEARWEKLKAEFYGFYPTNIQDQAYACLSGLSELEASRIIAQKTSRMEHEAILQPLVGESCDYEDAKTLNEEIQGMIDTARKKTHEEAQALQNLENELRNHSSFDKGDKDYTWNEISWGSENWSSAIRKYQEHTKSSVEAQLFMFQLQHAKARYDPRTQWIHVKTSPLYPDGKINSAEKASKELFSQVSRLFDSEESFSRPSSMTMNKEVNRQFQRFEYWLQKYGTGRFANFDALANNDLFQGYEFRVPYQSYSPKMCAAALHNEFRSCYTWIIVSKPDISGYRKECHSILVYFTKPCTPSKTNCKFGTTLRETVPHNFCFNCFGKVHKKSSCELPKYGFACG